MSYLLLAKISFDFFIAFQHVHANQIVPMAAMVARTQFARTLETRILYSYSLKTVNLLRNHLYLLASTVSFFVPSVFDIFDLGSVESNLDFEFETENQVYYSCIATLFGNFFVLGGSSQNGRQVEAKKSFKHNFQFR